MTRLPTLVLCTIALSCSKPAPHATEAAPAVVASPAAPSAFAPPEDAATAAAVVASAAPEPPERPAEEPPPKVKVISIGMHVAGGPFDEATKKPFLRAVEPHYPELARCWGVVKEPRRADVGVDILIPAAGGKAKISNPRSTIKSEGFLPCVVAFFESIEFDKPAKGGPQGLSYSVRFEP